MSLIGTLHHEHVFNRRVRVLAEHLSRMLPETGTLLDVGCGDGLLDKLIGERRPALHIEGIDVLIRPHTHIPVKKFDGNTIPYADNQFDVVMFVDVLHHTDDPKILLSEARRVARRSIVLKDHFREGFLAGPTLRFMDWVGNAYHGVVLSYNYWSKQTWKAAFIKLNLPVVQLETGLHLYPPPASWLFDRSLHFVARLDVDR